ncbi:hypothetical protein FJZ31_26530 [Candidatus Poribacteria bacterium]|nr:hypothetical protein [Candidatus Poribacteria bacterium]
MSHDKRMVLKRLAEHMRERKTQGENPYVLVLGAGASLSSGCSSTIAVVETILKELGSWSPELEQGSFEEKYLVFSNLLERMSPTERYVTLKPHLEAQSPSKGYRYLTDLVHKGYFRVILSTNFDRLVEQSLEKVSIYPGVERVIVGRDREEFIRDVLKYKNLPVILVKLHGDLFSRIFAFTNTEILEFSSKVSSVIENVLSEDLLIVGHSVHDLDILRCMHTDGGSIWYVNPRKPEGEIFAFMVARGSENNVISGEPGRFDEFFESLWRELSGRTIENFLDLLGMRGEIDNPQSYYLNLPRLYVEPIQLNSEIIPLLEQEHIVFIVGDPHMGKTYTALMLLWRNFLDGFNPIWVTTSQLQQFFASGPGAFERFYQEYLLDKHCIYIEDPFGRTDPLNIHEFVANIHNLVIEAKRRNLRIIVTSRTAQFDSVLKIGVRDYVVYLRRFMQLGGTYSNDDLKEILHRYAELYRPHWMGQPTLEDIAMRQAELLGAPHNIELFVRASIHASSISEIKCFGSTSRDVEVEIAGEFSRLGAKDKAFLFAVIFFAGFDIDESKTKIIFHDVCASGVQMCGTDAWQLSRSRLDRYVGTASGLGSKYLIMRHPSYEEAFIGLVKTDLETRLDVENALQILVSKRELWIRVCVIECILRLGLDSLGEEESVELLRQLLEDESAIVRQGAIAACIRDFKSAGESCRIFILDHVRNCWNERNQARFFCQNFDALEFAVAEKMMQQLTFSQDMWVRFKLVQWCSLPIAGRQYRLAVAKFLSRDAVGEVARIAKDVLSKI